MVTHIIKLVVGVSDLNEYAACRAHDLVDFEGQPAVPCQTRYQPKRAEEILKTGGSIYRVIKNRIQCRHRILGFDVVEIEGEGKFCRIMQDPQIIETISTPHRPFQGWRYLDPAKAPADRGVFDPKNPEFIPADLEDPLRAAGLI